MVHVIYQKNYKGTQ